MLDIVCVFCNRDVSMQRLQARSIAKYFDRARLSRVVYVWNETSEVPKALRC